MTQDLSGLRILVTGAASGIGAATAIDLAHAGADLVVTDISDLSKTLKALQNTGSDAVALKCNIADESDVRSLFEAIKTGKGGLDAAVNCAGILRSGRLLDFPLQEFDRILSINLRGSFLIARGAVELMHQHTLGRLIFVASELAYLGRAEFSGYCASKAGVIGLMRSLARELAPRVLVNAVAPGPIDTPMLGLEGMSSEWRAKEADNPLGRIGRPDEIASVVRFLCGPGATFLTGQTISPNGGAAMF